MLAMVYEELRDYPGDLCHSVRVLRLYTHDAQANAEVILQEREPETKDSAEIDSCAINVMSA